MMLKNIKVLDLSQYIPGPFVSRMLCDLGADVIKVEPPGGDPMRVFMHEVVDGVSPVYRSLNRGKRIVRLDLKCDDGIAQTRRLLGDADVLIDGFRPGTLGRLGLGRAELEGMNPRLVHCALSGFGQTGPNALKAGHDLGYCAAAGMFSFPGQDARPRITFPPLADHVGALQACNSTLAALYSRTQTGQGAFLDASMYEPLLAWQYLNQSERVVQLLSGSAACYNVYPTADEAFVTLAAIESKFWSAFCQAVEKTEWVDRQHEDFPQTRLTGEVSALFRTRTRAQWDEFLEQVDCCYESIPAPGEVAQYPQTASRALGGAYPCMIDGWPLPMSHTFTELGDDQEINWEKT